MAKPIGPSFYSELEAAGLVGLPFSWGADGDIQFDARMTAEQIDAVLAVYEAHDPNRVIVPPIDNYPAMIRRRADKLMRAGDVAGALLTLKQIGE
jgi:hypothetical protein